MAYFEPSTTDTAPEASQEILTKLEKNYGFLPNVFLSMASSPELLQAYVDQGKLFKETSLSPEEQNLVFLAASIENGCHFCAAAHSTVLRNSTNATDDAIDKTRAQSDLSDDKLNALVQFTREMTIKRGDVSKETLDAFRSAGYTKQHALEVVLAISLKVMTNYTNHLFGTELNEQFASEEYTPNQSKAA